MGMTRLMFVAFIVATVVAANAQESKPIAPMLTGLGKHTMPVSTREPWAQRFFDQGLALSYAFNHAESNRAFREAARLDPDCAMAHWGAALVLGPNVNAAMAAEDTKAAWEHIQSAIAHAGSATAKEQALINALSKRYAETPPADRAPLDHAYADAMREVARAYPDDVDVQTLFAESLMDLHPWDFWKQDGQPQEWTPEIVEVLKKALALDENHPGANHLFIHAVEASPDPGQATESADRLRTLCPSAGHLVHMPGHIYIRTGRYEEACEANRKAIAADDTYLTQCKAQGLYPMAYVPHNHHFLWAAACMEGNKALANSSARTTAARTDKSKSGCCGMGALQRFEVVPMLAFVRFGQWDEALQEPPLAKPVPYARAIHHYGRGLAYVRKGDFANAQKELQGITAARRDPAAHAPGVFNSDAVLAQIAEHVLSGEMASAKGQHRRAIRELKKAVKLEDGLIYQEPADWSYPVRHNLGAAYLAAGLPKEAEACFLEDMKKFAENGWSLMGLTQALEAQGRAQEAADVKARFEKAWQWSDVKINGARF